MNNRIAPHLIRTSKDIQGRHVCCRSGCPLDGAQSLDGFLIQIRVVLCIHAEFCVCLWTFQRIRVRFIEICILRRQAPQVSERCLRAHWWDRHHRTTAYQIFHPKAWAHHKWQNTHVQTHWHTASNRNWLIPTLGGRATRKHRRAHHAHIGCEARLIH